MDIETKKLLIESMFYEYTNSNELLKDTTLIFVGHRSSFLGQADWADKTVKLSDELLVQPLFTIHQVLVHELAHIMNAKKGHGIEFKKCCKYLGLMNEGATTAVPVDYEREYTPLSRGRIPAKWRYYLIVKATSLVIAGWTRKPKYTGGYRVNNSPYSVDQLEIIERGQVVISNI